MTYSDFVLVVAMVAVMFAMYQVGRSREFRRQIERRERERRP